MTTAPGTRRVNSSVNAVRRSTKVDTAGCCPGTPRAGAEVRQVRGQFPGADGDVHRDLVAARRRVVQVHHGQVGAPAGSVPG